MVTNNPQRTARLSAGLNRAFGEVFTFIPRARGDDVDLPAVPDADRAQFDATGIWSSGAKMARLHARGHADSLTQPAIASGPSVTFDEGDLPWTPTQVDLCKRQLDGSIYVVASVKPDSFGRVKFHLTAKKRA
jgi:hypothetical protein